MILFDSHSHIDDKCFRKDLDSIFQRADAAGVKAIMIGGIDVDTCERALSIAKDREHVFTSVGFHPHYAQHCSMEIMDRFKQMANEHDCVKAWGETGLDFNRMFSPQKDQEKWFSVQLGMAGEMDLPMIFHERESNGRFYEILKSDGPETRKGVVHCFSGNQKEMFQYLDLGYYIGITGILTHMKRGEYLRQIAPMIPNDRILIETDAPYLTPAPEKNKTRRNEPSFVKSVLLRLAKIKDRDPEELSQLIFENTKRLYGISRI